MPKTTPLITGHPKTEETGSLILQPEAETKGLRLRALPLRLALLAPCSIRGAAIWRDPPADQAKDADRKRIPFHHERDYEPDAALRRRTSGGNGTD